MCPRHGLAYGKLDVMSSYSVAGAPPDEPEPLTVADVYADLGGVAEVADALGPAVSARRVQRWVERRAATGCPEPVVRTGRTHIYSITHWRDWYALWRRTRGSETWVRR